jgi:hypothetical protein
MFVNTSLAFSLALMLPMPTRCDTREGLPRAPRSSRGERDPTCMKVLKQAELKSSRHAVERNTPHISRSIHFDIPE